MEPIESNPEDHRENLLSTFRMQENLLESAIGSLIADFKKNVEKLEEEFNEMVKALPPDESFDENGNRTYRFRLLTKLNMEQCWQKEQWLALNEVRVIYQFKSLEISLKSLVNSAYPSANIRDLFKWDSIINFFRQKNIDVAKVSGYREANELRILNNNLKHSTNIDDNVKRIPEFKDADFIDNPLIESFLERIFSKVKLFQISLMEEVRKDLYEFDEERLEGMAMDYFRRLRKDQAEILITKIREKYQM